MKKQQTSSKQQVVKENPEVQLLKAQLIRALADYDNLRKRTEEEKLTWITFATQKFIQNLLPVMDSFEAAQEHLGDSGLAIAIGQFKDLLKQEGLEEIRPREGESFDENLMEATEVVEGNEKNNNKISELVLAGWKFVNGQVIRHAKVKVYARVEGKEKNDD